MEKVRALMLCALCVVFAGATWTGKTEYFTAPDIVVTRCTDAVAEAYLRKHGEQIPESLSQPLASELVLKVDWSEPVSADTLKSVADTLV